MQDNDDERTYDLESAQIGITAIQVAQTDMMRALGAEPSAVVAMSMGEIAAAYAAGGLTLEETMRVACARSRLMGEGESMLTEDEQGGMAMVELSVDELDELLAAHPEFAGVERQKPGRVRPEQGEDAGVRQRGEFVRRGGG